MQICTLSLVETSQLLPDCGSRGDQHLDQGANGGIPDAMHVFDLAHTHDTCLPETALTDDGSLSAGEEMELIKLHARAA